MNAAPPANGAGPRPRSRLPSPSRKPQRYYLPARQPGCVAPAWDGVPDAVEGHGRHDARRCEDLRARNRRAVGVDRHGKRPARPRAPHVRLASSDPRWRRESVNRAAPHTGRAL